MDEPKVGRPIWFYAGPHETVMHSDQPLAAIVTYVHESRHNDAKASPLVNLAVFGRDGSMWARQSVHIWDGDGDAPERGSYARWQGDDAAEAIRDDALKAPKRGWGETEDAHKERLSKWKADSLRLRGMKDGYAPSDPSVRADGQAKTNVDHGPPRSWGHSPNSGGPLAIDDHEPKPQAEAAQKQHITDRDKAEQNAPAVKAKTGATPIYDRQPDSDTTIPTVANLDPATIGGAPAVQAKPKTQAESDQASYLKWKDERASEGAAQAGPPWKPGDDLRRPVSASERPL